MNFLKKDCPFPQMKCVLICGGLHEYLVLILLYKQQRLNKLAIQPNTKLLAKLTKYIHRPS